MSDSHGRIIQLIDLLVGLEPPAQPEAESWLRFTAERQELVDELQYLAERHPQVVTDIMHEGGRERIEEACRRIDEGMESLAFEAKSLRSDLANARQRRHKLSQHQRMTKAYSTESSLLSVG